VPLADIGPPAPYVTFDLSPDGRRLVVSRPKIDRSNLWLFDLNRNVTSQITFGRAFESDPRWGADGRRLMADAVPENGAQRRVVEIGLDGHQSVVLDEDVPVDDWSRDGRFLLYRLPPAELRVLPLFGDRRSILVRRATAGIIDQSQFAPDGRSIAYNSSESGRLDVYVTRFPPTGEQSQVSAEGGVQPVWRRDGRELYYLDPNGMIFAVEIEPTNLEPAAPRPLFRAPVGTVSDGVEQYTTVDGNRFLILKPIEHSTRPISVIVNWPATINGQRRR
jgi:Tol biopolymer transport system component